VLSVSRAMSLEQFLAQRGVGEKAQQVRLLNRLEGNPTLAPGQTLKVPVGGRLPGEE
jgi:hypothetical protein